MSKILEEAIPVIFPLICFPFKVDILVSQKWALEGICLGAHHLPPHYKQDRRQELSYRRSW